MSAMRMFGRNLTRERAFCLTALPATVLHNARLLAVLAGLVAAPAWASDAATSATAGGNRHGDGSAAATASYEGDVGFARTDSRSGRVNIARGVAVGVDQNGLSLSVSNAIAPQFGPAIATNFNMSIDRDGDVSVSGGAAVARSPIHREVNAGGSAGTGRPATATAGGETDRFGRVDAQTHARSSGPRILRLDRSGERRPVEVRRLRRW